MKSAAAAEPVLEAEDGEDLPAAPLAKGVALVTRPSELLDAVLAAAVAEVAATGVTGNAAMGKVMAIVKPKLAGKADMSAVSGKVKAKLG